jgi:hypothetical protein
VSLFIKYPPICVRSRMPQIYAPPIAYNSESGVAGAATLLGEPFYSRVPWSVRYPDTLASHFCFLFGKELYFEFHSVQPPRMSTTTEPSEKPFHVAVCGNEYIPPPPTCAADMKD